MPTQQIQLSDLNAKFVTDATDPSKLDLVLVLCHGFGAGGDDLVPLGSQLLEIRRDWKSRVGFLFPAAPIELEQFGPYESRAWWPLNIEKLMQSIEARNFEDRRNETPPGMFDARDQLHQALGAFQKEFGLSWNQLILGGFSQGAMVSTELTLHMPSSPAALCLYSGTLLCEERWTQLAQDKSALDILMSHGTTDPILPFEGAVALQSLFEHTGHTVDFIKFVGDHTIPNEAFMKTIDLIDRQLSDGSNSSD